MSQFRTYFYNLNTRKEVTDFEGNGKTWLGTSAMVTDKAGKFVKDTCSFVEIADYASFRSVKGRKLVTAEDFDFPVAVKVWFGPDNVEWRKLVKQEEFKAAA